MKTLSGFICVHRKMLDWEWHNDPNTFTVFMHLLLLANWKNTTWRGKPLKRGQLITSRSSLAEMTGLSERKVRTALKHLQQTGEVTIKTTKHCTLINVENYCLYQDRSDKNDQEENHQMTNEKSNDRPTKSPSSDHSVTKEQRNNKKKVGADAQSSPPQFVPPTEDEVRAYCQERKNHVDPAAYVDYYITRGWKLARGVQMKDWKASVRTWERREKKDDANDDEPWY